MVVKIKCRKCKKTWKIKRKTIKEARNTKKDYRECFCGTCNFKMLANKTAKEIVRGAKRIC